MKEFKSGFIALIGRPNVGKSTLLNNILGEKVAITSNKPQTTRNRVQGILTNAEAQMIFLDTPGIHKPKHKLGKYMVDVAMTSMKQVDLILYLVDVTAKFGPGEEYIIEQLKNTNTPVFLLLNKIDLLNKEELLLLIANYSKLFPFEEIIPISALKGENVENLMKTLTKYLPEGPMYYPEDSLTDQPEKQIMAEIIREKILKNTEQEVPHSVAVQIEFFKEKENGNFEISALIFVERATQKAIVIGKGGQKLKKIGQMARQEIEAIWGTKVFLEIWVKVKADWRQKEIDLVNFGFNKKDLE